MQFGHDGVSIRSGSSGGTLPAYSPRRSSRPSTARTEHASTVRTEHVYNRAPSGNSLTLKFRSDAHSASSTPTFSNLEQVPGRVELNVVNKSDILSVAVRIRCIYVTVAAVQWAVRPVGEVENSGYSKDSNVKVIAEAFSFLWPNTAGTKEPLSRGQYSWHFSLSMPSTSTDPKTGTEYPLPPSFIHKACPYQIQYQVEVTLHHKGYFSEDYSLITGLRYVPRTFPGPSSPLRLAAYSNGTPLPPPDVDPQGYKLHSFNQLTVRPFGTRDIRLDVSVALARPTQYPRGYPIPLFITLMSEDIATLDLLASPQAIRVSLRRTLLCGTRSDKRDVFQDDIVADGRCWLPAPIDRRRQIGRTVEGEVWVPDEADSSFNALSLLLEYTINITFQAAGIAFTSRSPSAFSLPVTITRNRAPGPKPLSYAPVPSYGRH